MSDSETSSEDDIVFFLFPLTSISLSLRKIFIYDKGQYCNDGVLEESC